MPEELAQPEPRDPRFPWRAVFQRTTAAVFVIGPSRRLRYANPAWEAVTGRPFAKARGMRISPRRSAGPLAQALAPPAEVWAGQPATTRRPSADADSGPPWWDVAFTPLPSGNGRVAAVIGILSVVAPDPTKQAIPADLGELRRAHAARFSFDLFAGPTPAVERLQGQARLAATTTVPVWLVGEPGSGKETLARVVHHNGPNRERACVGIHCGGLQPYLAEGLLFGKGGLIGSGHLGTLYLKEPADLPRDLQDRLAGLATSPKPPFRLICGSVRPAAEDVRAGRLIPPFHTELSVLELRIPPLRERLDDLPRLIDHLLDRASTPAGAKPNLADDLLPALRSHQWPGNIRELADVLLQAARDAGDSPIGRQHLPRFIQERHLIATHPPPPAGKTWTLDAVLEATERRLIELALRKANGSQTEAAAALGIPRARLARRIEALQNPSQRG